MKHNFHNMSKRKITRIFVTTIIKHIDKKTIIAISQLVKSQILLSQNHQ